MGQQDLCRKLQVAEQQPRLLDHCRFCSPEERNFPMMGMVYGQLLYGCTVNNCMGEIWMRNNTYNTVFYGTQLHKYGARLIKETHQKGKQRTTAQMWRQLAKIGIVKNIVIQHIP
jgi:hypothetical protein